MKPLFITSFITIVFLSSSCSSIDLSNKDAVKNHLLEYTFEYFDYGNSMTSFVQFYESSLKLTVFLDGKLATERKYSYSLGDVTKSRVYINVDNNSGTWSLKKDGNIYMHNQGELYLYQHKNL